MKNSVNEKQPSLLYVSMLGGLSIEYNGEKLPFSYTGLSKTAQLFLILVFQGKSGMERELLIEALYGKEDLGNSSNSLRATVFRLKKYLLSIGLPHDEFIQNKKGIYQWNPSSFETRVDARVFEEKAKEALNTPRDQGQLELLKQACSLYEGEFLPMFAAREWVAVAGISFQELYFSCLREASRQMKEEHQYEEMLEMCTRASEIYPFEEWQILQIDCLMALKRYREALKTYEHATNVFFEELGLSPSEKMLARFRTMSGQIHYATGAITDIRESLREKEWTPGAYYCGYPSFIDSYRFIARLIERTGQTACLMLCTFTDVKGNTARIEESVLSKASEYLSLSIQSSIRRGDLYTRYSPHQFLILLMEITEKNCSLVSDRITEKFNVEKDIRKLRVQYYVTPVTAEHAERDPSLFQFGNS